MNKDEFMEYKSLTLLHGNGANIHAINNQLGIMILAIGCMTEYDSKSVVEEHNEIINNAKMTISKLLMMSSTHQKGHNSICFETVTDFNQ